MFVNFSRNIEFPIGNVFRIEQFKTNINLEQLDKYSITSDQMSDKKIALRWSKKIYTNIEKNIDLKGTSTIFQKILMNIKLQQKKSCL